MRPFGPLAEYLPAQKWLHWTVALIILATIPIGLTMIRAGQGPVVNVLFELHKSLGLTVLALVVVRLVLRASHGAPPLVPGLPAWQRAAARASHVLLYTLAILTPLAGWTATSIGYPPVNLYWTVPVTLPFAQDEKLSERIYAVHNGLAVTLAVLVAVHIAAALHHHFVRRDRTLLRMLPGGPERSPAGRPGSIADAPAGPCGR